MRLGRICERGVMVTSGNPDDGSFARVSSQQSGILTTPQAVELLGRGIVRGHVRAGRWRSICRGIVMTSNGSLSPPQHLWVALLAAGPEAVLSGTTALTEAGVRGIRTGALRILVPADRKVSLCFPVMPGEMPSVRVTRTRVLPGEHRQAGSPPRVTTARALVDAAVWAQSGDAARTIIAMTFQQRKVLPEEVFEVLAMRRRLPRAKLIEQTVLDMAGGSLSLSEIDFKELCRSNRIPAPDRQVRRRDAAGRMRFLDVYWQKWRVHAEVDGSHHMETRHWIDDMLRQNQLWIAGDRLLRFPAGLVRSRPELVAGQLRAALEAAGWQSAW
ncbi:endonuclease domain-containing protein [Actinoplanes derwentensis]|uniref:DUF559 domain-containing protein n=1 Tax=Actinoplanes derwentensis TaxID=113562 RepID=A0A1H2D7W8_9ACTN|nr:endonuclease domain-containing protein [Actinoplanes derwentensis]GID86301.1 hypothetical protein Ade03nite_52250 [Actinoplanes derwentensis]SDT78657.1 hypothetical protein SAMN04489716_8463 [Actinoplanes derwentensis]